MAKTQNRYGQCPLCGHSGAVSVEGRCVQCGAFLSGRAAGAIAQADSAIQALSAQYDVIASQWKQWLEYREYYFNELEASRPQAAPVAAAAAPVAAPAAESAVAESAAAPAPAPIEAPDSPPAGDPFAEPAAPQPEPVAVGPEATTASATASTPAPDWVNPGATIRDDAAAPAADGPPESREPRPRRFAAAADALTAPVLLGIAGASLLIAAAIVFVALAWTTFSPAVRGTIVIAVALAVSGLAVWVRKLGLEVTSGAIGVVAMGFAGASCLSFSRETGTIGAFDIPAAMLAACVAGIILSRLRIPWVGPSAALALAGAAAGLTIAATSSADKAITGGATTVRGIWVWTLSGTVAAGGLAATTRLWRWKFAKTLVTWAAVIWLGFVGVSVPVWMWARDGRFIDAVVGLAPVAALVVLARWWPRLAVAPAALIMTLLPAAAVDTLGGDVWQQMSAAAVAIALMLATGPWAPRVVLWPLLIGLAPAYLTVAVASTVYSVTITVARILAGSYVPDTQVMAGVAALVAGLSVAQLRLWKLDSPWLRPAWVAGSVITVVGSGIAGFGLAELTGHELYHSSVAIVMSVAAVGLLLLNRAWKDDWARIVSYLGAIGFLVTAIVHSCWALAIAELALPLAILVAIAPLAALAVWGLRQPWWGLVVATLGIVATVGALCGRYDLPASVLFAAMLAAVTAMAWLGPKLREQLQSPVLAALGVASTLAVAPIAASLYAVTFTFIDVAATDPRPMWPLGVLLFGVALAAVGRWKVAKGSGAAASVVGAASVLLSSAAFAANAVDAWTETQPQFAPALLLAAAAASGLTTYLWRERAAKWTTGVGATIIAVLATLWSLARMALNWDSPWALLATALAAILALAWYARRFPQVTLTPSLVLATLVPMALMMRAGAATSAVVAAGAALAAGCAWLRWKQRLRPFAALGIAPALFASAVVGTTVVIVGMAQMVAAARLNIATTEYVLGAIAGFAALAIGMWRAPAVLHGIGQLGNSVRLRDLSVAAIVAVDVLATMLVWLVAHNGDVLSVAARGAAAGTAILAGTAIALATRSGLAKHLAPATVRGARWCAIGWVAVVAALPVGDVLAGRGQWQGALIIVAASIAALGAGWRWWPRAVAAPIAVLATLAPLALADIPEFGLAKIAFGVALVFAGLMWLARRARDHVREGLWIGLLPAAASLVVVAVGSAAFAVAAALRHLGGDVSSSLSPWFAAAVIVAVLGAIAQPKVREHAPDLVVGSLLVATAALSPLLACIAAGVLAVAVALWWRSGGPWAYGALVVSAIWAGVDSIPLTITAAAAAGVGMILGLRERERHTGFGAKLLPLAGALLLGASAQSTLEGWPFVTPAAVAGVGLGGAAAWIIDATKVRGWLVWVLSFATPLAPLIAQSVTAGGVALIIAAALWFALLTRGIRLAKWWCAAAASVGVALILAGAGVEAIEAYTAVPAAACIAIGIQWMREKATLPTLAALGPGLTISLVPSYIALFADANVTWRTAWLVVAMVVMVAIAIRKRWFAPVVFTASTALVVAAAQVMASTSLVPRLIAFVVVGSLLLAVASLFERLKELR